MVIRKLILIIFFCFFSNLLFSQTIVKLEKEGGIYLIPCKVNGKAMSFFFDTGASDVLISLEEAQKLYDEGLLKNTDFLLQTEQYQDAKGEITEHAIVYIREIEIGTLVLSNVKASIALAPGAPLLLGQSALSKFGEFTFNYNSNTLTINSNSNVDLSKRVEEAKKKIVAQGKEISSDLLFNLEKALRNEKNKQIINASLEIEVVKIDERKSEDGMIVTFNYDITNMSEIDYTLFEFSFDPNNIYIDVITEDGKIYSHSMTCPSMLSKRTATGYPISINIRNKIPKYFRIYPVSTSFWL